MMMEQVFHMSDAYRKKSRLKNRVIYATYGFWALFQSYLPGLLKGESGLHGDVTIYHLLIFVNLIIVTEFAFKPKWKDTIKLDAESLLLVQDKKEHFTLYSEIDRLIITNRSDQTIRRIKCVYDKTTCIIEGFEDMKTIALVLSQNVSKVSKSKVSTLFDSPLLPFLVITAIFTVIQLGFLVSR